MSTGVIFFRGTHNVRDSSPLTISVWLLILAAGESNSFGVEVGLHQGSALSPYLFLLLMDVLTEDVRKDVPGSMMFADDIVLCGDDETDMTEYLETWRRALEDRGMRISRPKTQFMDFKFGRDNG